MLPDAEIIDDLRKGIMLAVVHLFNTDPQDVIDTFTLEELQIMADETEAFQTESVEGIYKDLLDISNPENRNNNPDDG